jgi:hypothetical protein
MGNWKVQKDFTFEFNSPVQESRDEVEGLEEYSTRVNVECSEDHNYGADADGHRGVYQMSIEDIEVEYVSDSKGNSIPINKEFYDSAMYQAISDKVEELDLSRYDDDDI